MIKKVKIENYGSFIKEEINLKNNGEPISIIGMNDVGKTTLLHAIKSSTYGLNKKYGINDNTKIEIIFNISINDYSSLMKKIFKKEKIKLFEGDFTSIIRKPEKETTRLIFSSNNKIKKYFDEFISKINNFLIDSNKMKNILTDSKIENLWNKINNKERKNENNFKAILYLSMFLNLKKEIYRIAHESVFMIEADSKENFKFIKPSYTLRDTTDDEGQIIKSDWKEIKQFFKSFLTENEIKKLKKTIFSDLNEDDKRNDFGIIEIKITKEINKFFNDYFPSQNLDLMFNFSINENKIYMRVKDSTSKKFLSLDKRSDGFKWFLKLFLTIKNIKNGEMIIIDEPEKFLHASAQKELSKIFKKLKLEKNIQIIYATHSPFILDKSLFPSLKIIIKEKNSSKIFNNINAFINQNNKNIKDVLLPITMSLGINIFEFAMINNVNIFLFVEGEANLYFIKIAELIAKKNIKNNYFILPKTGKTNEYGETIVKLHGFKWITLLDGMENDKLDNKIYLNSLFKNNKIMNPEDILSNDIKKKYKIDIIDKNEKKILNHKMGWKKNLMI